MAKTTNTTARKSAPKAAPKGQDNTTTASRVELDWNAECNLIAQAAKEKPGSRGNMLGKLAVTLASGSPAAMVMREAASLTEGNRVYGAQAFIQQPRNVLDKLPKIAGALAAGKAYCDHSALGAEGVRTADASVPVALVALGAGDARQKAIVAAVSDRYKGGGNAQMPAALGGLEFFGIVKRLNPEAARNAEYAIIDEARASSLIPKADIVG